MTGELSKFIKSNKKALSITLRAFVAEFYAMAAILKLNKEETNTIFDPATGVPSHNL